MEFWNTRNMLAPPTYTYEGNADDIDIDHFKSILQDGISFYNDQNVLSIEVALLSRIIYRMKTKFRNSKDFQTLEKVKKDLNIFEGMNISKKLEYLLSILPNFSYQDIVVSLPTKNMIDYILVQLQGIGKILCKAIETCKHTVIIYEHRLYLGHFWKLALIAIALVSRIHILCLNIVKFTCLLYLRLLPFSHKLKNVTTNWLPKDYVFPKDLKIWLNVEWAKLEEVIEIPEEFNLSSINLVEDSDDEVEFIEVNDAIEIIEDFRKIRRSLYFDPATAFRSNHDVDLGEEILIEEDEVQVEGPDNIMVDAINEIAVSKKGCEDKSEAPVEGFDIGEEISLSESESCEGVLPHTENNFRVVSSSPDIILKHNQPVTEIDIGEVISSGDEIFENPTQASGVPLVKKENFVKKKSCQVVISSSDDENSSVLFVGKSRKPFVTSDFIPLQASSPSHISNVNRPEKIQVRRRKGKNRMKNTKDASIAIIPDSPISGPAFKFGTPRKRRTGNAQRSASHKAQKRKSSDRNESLCTAMEKLPSKKRRK